MMKILMTILLCFISTKFISADEIIVFYNQKPTIKDAEIVKKHGHTLRYMQMDMIKDIEEETSQRTTETHQHQMKEIVKKYGAKKLMALSDTDRTRLFLTEFKRKGIDIYRAEINQKNMDRVKKAVKILEFANEQGVTRAMLPAIIFKDKLYRNVTTYAFLFKKEKAK